MGLGKRRQVKNTEELRAWALDLTGPIRSARAAADHPILVSPKPDQRRACGQRAHRGQARL